jgi:hypothetical protein
MGVDDPVTLGELSRRLDAMERRFEGEFGKLGRSIHDLQFVHHDQYRAERDALVHRVAELEDAHTWIVRAVIASILFPLIVTVIGVILIGGGA